MTIYILPSSGKSASRLPCRSFQFPLSHLHPHPPPSNENITTRRNIAVWPARSARPRLVLGLFIKGGKKPSYPGCMDV
jgi:hypothetical protein